MASFRVKERVIISTVVDVEALMEEGAVKERVIISTVVDWRIRTIRERCQRACHNFYCCRSNGPGADCQVKERVIISTVVDGEKDMVCFPVKERVIISTVVDIGRTPPSR